jgi:hypothetical protein
LLSSSELNIFGKKFLKLNMAQAQNCFACNEGLDGEAELVHRCTFCHKAFHKLCALSTAAAPSYLTVGFLCSFGCLQAFEAGREHRKLEVEQPGCRCPECGQIFSKPGNMKTHLKTKHQKMRHGPCVCCFIPVSFTSKQRLQTHMESRREAVLKALRQL